MPLIQTKPWSKLYDRCQNPDCTTPHSAHKGRGLCKCCHWKARYRTNPDFREAVKRKAKLAFMRGGRKASDRNAGWRRDNQELCKLYRKRYRDRVKAATGHSFCYRWKIGTTASIKNLGITGLIASQVAMLDDEKVVDILLRGNTIMEGVPLRSLTTIGFSIEDAEMVNAVIRGTADDQRCAA